MTQSLPVCNALNMDSIMEEGGVAEVCSLDEKGVVAGESAFDELMALSSVVEAMPTREEEDRVGAQGLCGIDEVMAEKEVRLESVFEEMISSPVVEAVPTRDGKSEESTADVPEEVVAEREVRLENAFEEAVPSPVMEAVPICEGESDSQKDVMDEISDNEELCFLPKVENSNLIVEEEKLCVLHPTADSEISSAERPIRGKSHHRKNPNIFSQY